MRHGHAHPSRTRIDSSCNFCYNIAMVDSSQPGQGRHHKQRHLRLIPGFKNAGDPEVFDPEVRYPVPREFVPPHPQAPNVITLPLMHSVVDLRMTPSESSAPRHAADTDAWLDSLFARSSLGAVGEQDTFHHYSQSPITDDGEVTSVYDPFDAFGPTDSDPSRRPHLYIVPSPDDGPQ